MIYAGTNDMTNIEITIQHRYYYIKYKLYDHLPDFLPVFQSNLISWKNRSLRDGMSSESIFNMYVINPLYF